MDHSVLGRQLDHRIAAMQHYGMIATPVSKRGTITLPPDMCRKLGLDAAAAEAMAISKAGLSDVIRQRKGVSASLALRAQYSLGIPGDLLIRLQAQFDFQKAHHAREGALRKEVRVIV